MISINQTCSHMFHGFPWPIVAIADGTSRPAEACTACCLDTHLPSVAVAIGAAIPSAPAEAGGKNEGGKPSKKGGLLMFDLRKS